MLSEITWIAVNCSDKASMENAYDYDIPGILYSGKNIYIIVYCFKNRNPCGKYVKQKSCTA